MVYKKYSKIELYPVVYLKDTNLNFIYDTNGNKAIDKNYPEVLSTDNYVILKNVINYAPKSPLNIISFFINGVRTLTENFNYNFQIFITDKSNNFKTGDLFKIKLLNVDSTEFSITPNNGLVSLTNNKLLNFNIKFDEDYLIEGEESFIIQIYNENETILYDQFENFIAKDIPSQYEILLLGPSTLRLGEDYTTYIVQPETGYSIPDGTPFNIELIGENTDLIIIDSSVPFIFNNNQGQFRLKAVESIPTNELSLTGEYSFQIKITSDAFQSEEFIFTEIEIIPEVITIDTNLLTLNLERSISFYKNPIGIISDNQNEITTTRKYDPYTYTDITLTNTQKEMVVFCPEIWFWQYGFDHNFPSYTDIINIGYELPPGDDGENFPIFKYSTRNFYRFLNLNTSYLTFVNDPYPNTTFSNTAPNGDSAKIADKNHLKYPIYDELNKIVLTNADNKASIINDLCFYINEDNKLLIKFIGQAQRYWDTQIEYASYSPVVETNWYRPMFVNFVINSITSGLSFNPSQFISLESDIYTDQSILNNVLNNLKLSINSNRGLYNDVYSIDKSNLVIEPTTAFEFTKNHLDTDNFFQQYLDSLNSGQPDSMFTIEDTNIENNIETNTTSFAENYSNYFKNLVSSSTNNTFNTNKLNNSLYPSWRIIGANKNYPEQSGYRDVHYNETLIKSIKSTINCVAYLDINGSLRILFYPYTLASAWMLNSWSQTQFISNENLLTMIDFFDPLMVFYDKEELENNFWIDENGLVEYLPNEDFIDFEIYGMNTHLYYATELIFIYALHKSGKLYARELTTGLEQIYSNRLVCTLDNTDNLNIGDIVDVTEHDVDGLSTQNYSYSISNEWELIFKDTLTNKCVFQTKNVLSYEVVNNPYRAFYVYRNDILTKKGTNNTYRIIKLHSETNLGTSMKDPIVETMYEPVIDLNYQLITDQDDLERQAITDYLTFCSVFTKIKKIDPYINNTLNPNFLTVKSNALETDMVGDCSYMAGGRGSEDYPSYTFYYDPHKKIYLWEDENIPQSEIRLLDSGVIERDLITGEIFAPVPKYGKGIKINPNGLIEHIKMSLKQIPNNKKVIKIISNNDLYDGYYGSYPSFILKTTEYKNTLINDTSESFYSYSYEILIMDAAAAGSLYADANVFASKENFQILSPTINNKVFENINGNLTQVGWESVANPTFNETLYNLFIKKPLGNKVSTPVDLLYYYCPIRSASLNYKSFCLLNNEGECLVINDCPDNFPLNYFKDAIKSFDNLDTDHERLRKQGSNITTSLYWLYNRGTAHQLSSDITYNLLDPTEISSFDYPTNIDYHVLSSFKLNVYTNANDPISYDTEFITRDNDNSLVNPVIFEETIYGLGNPPSTTNSPYGLGMNIQQFEGFDNFTTTSDDSKFYIAKDIEYIDVLYYTKVNETNTGGSDIVLFKVKNNLPYKIELAETTQNNFLYILLSNGVVDVAEMGSIMNTDPNGWTQRTVPGTNRYIWQLWTTGELVFNVLINAFNSVKRTTVGYPFRTPVEDLGAS